MDQQMQDFIIDILDEGKDLTLATLREDGYPQATTVSYAHDGLTIYVGIGRASQKLANIRRSNKVSLTVNKDYKQWSDIQGLSMSATAEVLEREEDLRTAAECIAARFPEVKQWGDALAGGEVVLLRITPQVVSVLDYTKGFGHTDLVRA